MNTLSLPLKYAIAAGIDYPLMERKTSKPSGWAALYNEIGYQDHVDIKPWQPLHTTIAREMNKKQFALAKRCMPILGELDNPIVKDYALYKPTNKDYEAIVQRIDAPIFREVHDVIADGFCLHEHYPFELHVTLVRVVRCMGEFYLSHIAQHYAERLSQCQFSPYYFHFNPDESWTSHDGVLDSAVA